jgi:predicted acylesterase/phospholipase RssA
MLIIGRNRCRLSRTKLGLALGAGGAKGYAHIGVFQVLQAAGYTVDYVAGSSIG